MKISICRDCGFKTKEKHQNCPMCLKHMDHIKDDFNPQVALPSVLPKKDCDVDLFYTCPKCQEKMRGVCLNCNRIGLLTISYNGKTAIVKQLNSLFDIFNENEVNTILSQLSLDEKYFLYYQFKKTIYLLTRRDSLKASVCFFVGILMYSLSLSITFSLPLEYIIIGYASNAFGNAVFSIFMILGILYLFIAHRVEKEKIAKDVGIICGSIHFLYLLICIIFNFSILSALILGFLIIALLIIFCVIYYFARKR